MSLLAVSLSARRFSTTELAHNTMVEVGRALQKRYGWPARRCAAVLLGALTVFTSSACTRTERSTVPQDEPVEAGAAAVAAPAGIPPTVPALPSNAETPTPERSDDAEIEGAIAEAKAAIKRDANRAAGISSARSVLSRFWRARGGAFPLLEGRLTKLKTCGKIFATKGCIEAEIEFRVGKERFKVAHVDLTERRFFDADGNKVALSESGFDGFAFLAPDSDPAKALGQVEAPGLFKTPCVRASGRVFDALQSEGVSVPEFVGMFGSIVPCTPQPVETNPRDWSQSGYLSVMAKFARRAEKANSAQVRIIAEEARAYEREFFSATDGNIDGWTGDVDEYVVVGARRTSFAVRITPDGTAPPQDDAYRYRLRSSVAPSATELSDVALSLANGRCVRISGRIAQDENGVDVLGPSRVIELTKLATCGGTDRRVQGPGASGWGVGAAAVAGGAAAGGAAVAAELAGTTSLALIPTIAANGAPMLMLGAVQIPGSALAAASAGLGAAATAGLGFYALGKAVQHIDEKIEINQAATRVAYSSDAQEYFAFARHVCPGQSMNSSCFRNAFREAATFVASSPSRLYAVTAATTDSLSPAQQRWRTNFLDQHSGDESRPAHVRGQAIAKRVLKLSSKARADCRKVVDLVHQTVQESTIQGDARRISGGDAEDITLGGCLDLFLLEDDYLHAEGLALLWRKEWEKTGYASSENAVRGWSDGSYAAKCEAKEAEMNTGKWLLRTDCSLHAVDHEIRCVCLGTPEMEQLNKLEAQARKAWMRRIGK
jgi:hypothetical protein